MIVINTEEKELLKKHRLSLIDALDKKISDHQNEIDELMADRQALIDSIDEMDSEFNVSKRNMFVFSGGAIVPILTTDSFNKEWKVTKKVNYILEMNGGLTTREIFNKIKELEPEFGTDNPRQAIISISVALTGNNKIGTVYKKDKNEKGEFVYSKI